MAQYGWLFAAVICVALVISFRPHTTERVIRITGLVLQLLGICMVFLGISKMRALFELPSFASKTKALLSRFHVLRRHVVNYDDGVSTGGLVFGGRGEEYTRHGPGANLTNEARLEALEKNVTLVDKRISQTRKEIDGELQKTAAALKREEDTRKAEEKAIRERLKATGVGSVHISLIGASWLAVGLILSTAAIEIAELLK